MPKLDQVLVLRPSVAVLVSRVGDLGLIRGDWPILGRDSSWKRSDWPTPVFIRREILPPFRNWRVYYSEIDPSVTVKEELDPRESPDLPEAGSSGSGAVEIKLTKLLAESKRSFEAEFQSSPIGEEKTALAAPTKGGLFRNEVLQKLQKFDSDTRKPHHFEFYLYFRSQTAAHDAAKKIREKQFTAEVVPSADGSNWLCRASTVLTPETSPLDEVGGFLEHVASTLHGDFDGWESNIVK